MLNFSTALLARAFSRTHSSPGPLARYPQQNSRHRPHPRIRRTPSSLRAQESRRKPRTIFVSASSAASALYERTHARACKHKRASVARDRMRPGGTTGGPRSTISVGSCTVHIPGSGQSLLYLSAARARAQGTAKVCLQRRRETGRPLLASISPWPPAALW